MLGNIAEGLMLTGGGIIIGGWLSLWLAPSDHKLNMIRVSICGAISIVAFIWWVKLGTFPSLMTISEWPILGVVTIAIITYSISVAAIEPILMSFNRHLRASGKDLKKAMQDAVEDVEKYERKREKNSFDRRFKEWEKRQGSKRQEPRVGDRNLSEDLMDEGQAYIAKEQLMTPSEQFAYKVIEHKYKDRFHIFAQVRVVDIIKPNPALYKQNSKEFNSLFRQLSQWHFDFVLCYREDFRICCAIELDDPSHGRKARQKRDRILNRACEVAGVRIERMRLNFESKMVERI